MPRRSRLVSEQPNPALPRILPTPTLGIVNSDVVIENGGTDQPGADTDDTAEEFLNSTSAGSGPYILESFSTTSETVIARNPEYVGPNTGDVRPHRVPQQRRDDAGDRRAERQRRHRHGPRQRPARTAARRRGSDDRRDRLAEHLLPVRQRQPGDLRGDVQPRLRRSGALRPRLRRHPRARRRRRRAGTGRDPDALPRHAVARPRRPARRRQGAGGARQMHGVRGRNGAARVPERPHRQRPVVRARSPSASSPTSTRSASPSSWRRDRSPRRWRTTAPATSRWVCGCGTRTTRIRRTTSCSDQARSSACVPAGPRAPPRRSRRCRRRRRRPSTTQSGRRCSSSSSRCSTSRARSSR